MSANIENLNIQDPLTLRQYEAMLTGVWISDLANTTAFLKECIPNCNWIGFYLLDGDTLNLGPFQGKIACTQIKIGRGVCGMAVKLNQIMRVDDVHRFSDHIACDAASNSELVIPLVKDGKTLGVLDLDSPLFCRFGENEELFCKKICEILLAAQSFSTANSTHF